MTINLAKRVCIITGSARGIGKSIAQELLARGARVVINDIDEALLLDVAAQLGSADAVEPVVADVGTAEGGRLLTEGAIERWGRVDVLVNNAGVTRDAVFHKMEAAQWDQVISTHVNALFNCTQPVAKHLSARYKNDPNDGGGSIICMSSTSGLAGNVGQCNYGAAKAAVLGFVLSLAKEAGRYGARVNAVVPSAWTRLTSAIPEAVLVKHVGEAALQDMKARRPEHIAPIVGYLASTAAEGVTGQIVRASGNRLGLFSRPAEIDSVYTESAWTAESVAQAFDQSLRSQLDPLTSLGDL